MKKKVIITDRMQRGYVYWRTEPVGRNFAPGFTPDLTPKEMLRLGIFGGKYMTDCQEEFPRSWFARARLCAERHDARLNCFGVNASQSLAVWRRSGWIHKQDPRGWFQWYCRYYMGRRTADDARQIRRWRAIARHVAAIRKHCEPGDLECRRRQRQAVLHWAYDSRKIWVALMVTTLRGGSSAGVSVAGSAIGVAAGSDVLRAASPGDCVGFNSSDTRPPLPGCSSKWRCMTDSTATAGAIDGHGNRSIVIISQRTEKRSLSAVRRRAVPPGSPKQNVVPIDRSAPLASNVEDR